MSQAVALLRRAFCGLSVAWCALALAGCGGGVGQVSGTVSFQKKPVQSGTVMIIGSDSLPYYGSINKDGAFAVEKVPAGEAKVAVNSPDPRGPKARPGGRPVEGRKDVDPKTWFELPPQYGDFNQSGLTLTVRRGENKFDIDMK
jgi:hypothetical protein